MQVFIFVGMSFYRENSARITLLNFFGIDILCVFHASQVPRDKNMNASMHIVDRPLLDGMPDSIISTRGLSYTGLQMLTLLPIEFLSW